MDILNNLLARNMHSTKYISPNIIATMPRDNIVGLLLLRYFFQLLSLANKKLFCMTFVISSWISSLLFSKYTVWSVILIKRHSFLKVLINYVIAEANSWKSPSHANFHLWAFLLAFVVALSHSIKYIPSIYSSTLGAFLWLLTMWWKMSRNSLLASRLNKINFSTAAADFYQKVKRKWCVLSFKRTFQQNSRLFQQL